MALDRPITAQLTVPMIKHVLARPDRVGDY